MSFRTGAEIAEKKIWDSIDAGTVFLDGWTLQQQEYYDLMVEGKVDKADIDPGEPGDVIDDDLMSLARELALKERAAATVAVDPVAEAEREKQARKKARMEAQKKLLASKQSASTPHAQVPQWLLYVRWYMSLSLAGSWQHLNMWVVFPRCPRRLQQRQRVQR